MPHTAHNLEDEEGDATQTHIHTHVIRSTCQGEHNGGRGNAWSTSIIEEAIEDSKEETKVSSCKGHAELRL